MKRCAPHWANALLLFGGLLALGVQGRAATLTVTTTADAGAGSLRQAIIDANNAPGNDAIDFNLPGAGPHVISLLDSLPNVDSNIAILNQSNGSEAITVQRSTAAGTANFRILLVNSGNTVTVSDLTFKNGLLSATAGTSALGGAIRNDGDLTVLFCTFINNQVVGGAGTVSGGANGRGGDAQGGALYNSGTLTVITSIFDTNSALAGNGAGTGQGGAGQGGALYNSSSATAQVSDCNFLTSLATGGNGNTPGGGQGGAIRNSGTLSLLDCSFQNNTANHRAGDAQGGNIYNSGTLTGVGCKINSGNANSLNDGVGQGGGVRNSGTLTLTNSTIMNGFAFGGASFGSGTAVGGPGVGAGLYNSGSTTITGCTISANLARGGDSSTAQGGAGLGGGIYNSNSSTAVLNMKNCTLSGNTATGGNSSGATPSVSLGGGIFMEGGGSGAATLTGVTVALNDAADGTGILVSGGNLILNNTIVSNNGATQTAVSVADVRGAVNAASQYNLIGDGSELTGITNGTNGNQIGGGALPILDAKLGPLQNNAGPTQTHALLDGSPALDKGKALGLTTDQRGITRPYDDPAIANASGGDGSDIGAFEQRPAALPKLNINDVTVAEGSGANSTATFTVTLSAASTQTVTVGFNSVNGTAKAPTDYTSTSSTLTFTPGQTSKTISVAVVGDSLDENDETFFVFLSLPTNASLFKARGVATISDDDAAPNVTIDNVSLPEGNSGQRYAVLRLNLSAASGRLVEVSYYTQNGAATAPADYTAIGNATAPATVAFSVGSTVAYIRVLVNGDELNEANETFAVNLTGSNGANVADNQAIGTILNDDSAPALTINDASITEGNPPSNGAPGTKNLTFTVTLSKASGQTVTVNYATADGIARSTSDYVAQSGTVSFAPGSALTRTVNIVVRGDAIAEGNETLYVLLTNAVNASVGRARGTGTIVNDDASG